MCGGVNSKDKTEYKITNTKKQDDYAIINLDTNPEKVEDVSVNPKEKFAYESENKGNHDESTALRTLYIVIYECCWWRWY